TNAPSRPPGAALVERRDRASARLGAAVNTHRIARPRIAGRLAAVLLATTCLTPVVVTVAAVPAHADGGAGGQGFSGTPGAGGPGFTGQAGGAAAGDAGGGGGAAGGPNSPTVGNGGAGGTAPGGGAVGTGGTLATPNGGNGNLGVAGGTGGGGGFSTVAPIVFNIAALTGGAGGNGGHVGLTGAGHAPGGRRPSFLLPSAP